MTPQASLFLLLVLVLLFMVRNHGMDRLRCGYCGEVNGHADGCPYEL